jgi:hypothetical protein
MLEQEQLELKVIQPYQLEQKLLEQRFVKMSD